MSPSARLSMVPLVICFCSFCINNNSIINKNTFIIHIIPIISIYTNPVIYWNNLEYTVLTKIFNCHFGLCFKLVILFDDVFILSLLKMISRLTHFCPMYILRNTTHIQGRISIQEPCCAGPKGPQILKFKGSMTPKS